MNRLNSIFKYIKPFPKLVAAYSVANVLSALFSVVSLGLLGSFLGLIFKQTDVQSTAAKSGFMYDLNPLNRFNEWVANVIKETNAIHPGSNEGEIKVLGIICLVVLTSIILKNVFVYLSMYYLNP